MLNGKHDQPSLGRIGQSLIVTGNGNSPLTPDREFETFALLRRRKPSSDFEAPGSANLGALAFQITFAAVTLLIPTP